MDQSRETPLDQGIEQLRSYFLSEINSLYLDALNFHELQLLELAPVQQDQESRELYQSQIRLMNVELRKLEALAGRDQQSDTGPRQLGILVDQDQPAD